MKKISRNYRIHPVVDRLVKLGARCTGESEADFISLCVTNQTPLIIGQTQAMQRLLAAPLPREIERTVLEARRAMVLNWARAGLLKLSRDFLLPRSPRLPTGEPARTRRQHN